VNLFIAIINNVAQRPVLVGNANPNYTTMSQIAPYLKKCVLTTEDPPLFITVLLVASIDNQNIKQKKFSRGASTISMQLVKNVFLTREKQYQKTRRDPISLHFRK
jgi:membrane peptidoglycan carboxypeptidase